MEFLTGMDLNALFDNGAMVVTALLSMVVALANLLTVFVDEGKVSKYVKPVITVLNFLALNVFKNKNATDV
jgi:hypothetical protein